MEEAGPFYFAHETSQQYLSRVKSMQKCVSHAQDISLPPYDTWKPDGMDDKHIPKLDERYWRHRGPKSTDVIKDFDGGQLVAPQLVWPDPNCSETPEEEEEKVEETSTEPVLTAYEKMIQSESFILQDIIGDDLMNEDGKTYSKVSDCQKNNKYLILYFSTEWCPWCKEYTPKLAKYYNDHHEAKNFELIFVSQDKERQTFNRYFKTMPWKAIPYIDRDKKDAICELYNVPYIHNLRIIILLAATGEIICEFGKDPIEDDPEAKDFPYKDMPKKKEEEDLDLFGEKMGFDFFGHKKKKEEETSTTTTTTAATATTTTTAPATTSSTTTAPATTSSTTTAPATTSSTTTATATTSSTTTASATTSSTATATATVDDADDADDVN